MGNALDVAADVVFALAAGCMLVAALDSLAPAGRKPDQENLAIAAGVLLTVLVLWTRLS